MGLCSLNLLKLKRACEYRRRKHKVRLVLTFMYLGKSMRKPGNEKRVKVSMKHVKFVIMVRWGRGGGGVHKRNITETLFE